MAILTRAGYAFPGTSLNFKTGSWRVQKPVHRHHPAPCHTACPAGEDAQAYIAHVQAGHLQQAWETLVEANPLPAVTGRVCPHPCESACNRGQYDEAIAIHSIERFLGDQAIEQGWPYPVLTPVTADAPEIAIVGAGPAGLSAAYQLVRRGYRVTLFDEYPEAGGTLRTALPSFRLPRAVLDNEVNRILAMDGMSFKPHVRVGRDVQLRELESRYRAVFLAPGAQKSQDWNIDGASPSDLQYGLDLLKEWVALGTLPTPRSVAVIGAGNTAVDIARVLKRAGVPEVHIISHKPIPKPGVPASEAMPAIQREVEEALEEGVIIHEHRGIRRLILRGERVVGVEMVRMKKLPQSGGRLKRIAFEGTETILKVEQVIPAIGQSVDARGFEALIDNRGQINVDYWGQLLNEARSPLRNLYAGGDATGKAGTVTAAVGDGRRAALAIERRLNALPTPEQIDEQPIAFDRLNLHYYEHGARVREPVVPVADRGGDEEIVMALDGAHIGQEAARCFSCGNCLACDNCWTLCPDSAVLKTAEFTADGSHYAFDYDYCKGCGVCAQECPCGYIDMADEI